MLLLICTVLVLFFLVPVTLAYVESAGSVGRPMALEFWTFARTIGARCHVPSGRSSAPRIVKDTDFGQFRLRAYRSWFGRWTIEGRLYLDYDFRFAGRLVSPPSEPLKWRTPSMTNIAIYEDEMEHLGHYSLEASNEPLMRWFLRHPDVRATLNDALEDSSGESFELILANRTLIARVRCPKGWRAGDSIEHTGQVLFGGLLTHSQFLRELSELLTNEDGALAPCPSCAQNLGVDPYRCQSCGLLSHRGCREMIQGCQNLNCEACVDYLAGGAEGETDVVS